MLTSRVVRAPVLLSLLAVGCESSELLLVRERLAPAVTASVPVASPRVDSGALAPRSTNDAGRPRDAGASGDASRPDAALPRVDAGDAGREVLDSPVAAVNLPGVIDTDPTFTADLCELFFMSTRDGSKDLFRSLRSSPDEPWGSPTRVDELSLDGQEENPFISADGLEIWFFTDRDRGLGSIWHATRERRTDPWGEPSHATGLALAEGGSDVAVSVDSSRTIFMLNSKLPGAPPYGIHEFLIEPETSEPTLSRTLTEVNSEGDDFDPDLREDGRFIAFDSARLELRQIFWTRRSALDQPFAEPQPLTAEPEGDESAPAFSEDLRYLMFSSTRSGDADIYERRLSAAP